MPKNPIKVFPVDKPWFVNAMRDAGLTQNETAA